VPSVAELTAVYGNFMLNPRRGPGVCSTCFTFTDGYDRCFVCARTPSCLDVVAPVSYSIAHEQLHHALASYKRLAPGAARQLRAELAAVLWRYLTAHERCVAAAATAPAARAETFGLVTTVPSGDRTRDRHHPLREIVSHTIGPTRSRYERLLERSAMDVPPRTFEPNKFRPRRTLDGDSVLLIDDTWTTGASAQSAAAALKNAGAGPVAVVVIGRHLKRDWHQNDRRLRAIPRPYDWDRCAFCADQAERSD
jgi:predicted amidophosphoribosyltransferase